MFTRFGENLSKIFRNVKIYKNFTRNLFNIEPVTYVRTFFFRLTEMFPKVLEKFSTKFSKKKKFPLFSQIFNIFFKIFKISSKPQLKQPIIFTLIFYELLTKFI